MTTALAQHAGENGVVVEVRDETRPYAYADVFRVRLLVTARWPGRSPVYERALERLGVRGEDLEDVRSELLGQFERHTLPYLWHPTFPQRLAEHRRRSLPKILRFPSLP